MLPYYVLIFLPVFYSFIRIKGQSLEKRNKSIISTFFFIFLLMLMLRDVDIGRDLPVYSYYFKLFSRTSLQKALLTGIEPGYIVLNKIVARFTDDFQWMIVITAVLTVIPMWYTYRRTAQDPALSISLFLIMPTFVMSFSGIRQILAISIGLIAYEATRKRKFILYLLLVLLAISFHRSAFVLAAMYPLYHAKITKKWLIVVIPAMCLVYLFNDQIFHFLGQFIVEYYVGATKETGAYMMLVLFILFGIYAFVVPRDAYLDSETTGLRNFLLLAIALQMFAPLHSLAMRMNYYYIIFIPILIPRIIKFSGKNWYTLALIARYVMVLYFLFYFFDHAPSGNILDTFPYKFFWEG